mgnify:CR=1 FL=1
MGAFKRAYHRKKKMFFNQIQTKNWIMMTIYLNGLLEWIPGDCTAYFLSSSSSLPHPHRFRCHQNGQVSWFEYYFSFSRMKCMRKIHANTNINPFKVFVGDCLEFQNLKKMNVKKTWMWIWDNQKKKIQHYRSFYVFVFEWK